jgi:hypothetical protein
VVKIISQIELLFPNVVGRARSIISGDQRSTRKRRRTAPKTRKTKASKISQPVQLEAHSRVGHDALVELRLNSRSPRGKSDEFLLSLWINLRREFFPEHPHVDDYTVTWSPRAQKRVLASCNIRRRRVVVAQELFEPSATRWLAPVLYHEMCHAVIGEGVHLSQSGKRLWHGAQFRKLESRHPDIKAMNLWIATGGWAMAVRSHRARRAWRERVSGR